METIPPGPQTRPTCSSERLQCSFGVTFASLVACCLRKPSSGIQLTYRAPWPYLPQVLESSLPGRKPCTLLLVPAVSHGGCRCLFKRFPSNAAACRHSRHGRSLPHSSLMFQCGWSRISKPFHLMTDTGRGWPCRCELTTGTVARAGPDRCEQVNGPVPGLLTLPVRGTTSICSSGPGFPSVLRL